MEDDRIEQHYFEHAKKGVVLSAQDLKAYARKENIPIPTDKKLRDLRHLWKFLAIHSRWTRPKYFMSPTVARLGNLYVDMAEMHKNLRVHNKNRHYFLVCVDALSQKTMAIAYPNKSQQTWEDGIKQFIDNYPCARNIIVDRDSSVSGLAFQQRLYKETGVKFIHLRSRSKSYLAERAIRTIKTRVQQALDLNYPDLNWIQYLKPVCDDHNQRFVKHTNIRRIDVDKTNELKVIQMQFGVKDVGHLFNSSTASNFSPHMLKKMRLPFQTGDRVLVSKSANYEIKKDAFTKKSITGNYSKRVYTIDKPVLKANADQFLTIAYKINGLEGLFYPSEITRALFHEQQPRDEDKEEEKKKKERARRKREQE